MKRKTEKSKAAKFLIYHSTNIEIRSPPGSKKTDTEVNQLIRKNPKRRSQRKIIKSQTRRRSSQRK